MMLLLQEPECHQLLTAAKAGDVVTVERLIHTRYIDVNTIGGLVSTFYGVVSMCD